MQSKNNPLITVVVPIYKVEAYLDECVQSILKHDIFKFRNHFGG